MDVSSQFHLFFTMMMIKSFVGSIALLLLSGVFSVASSSPSFSHGFAGVAPRGSLFGVPRGGGLFGGKDENKKDTAKYV